MGRELNLVSLEKSQVHQQRPRGASHWMLSLSPTGNPLAGGPELFLEQVAPQQERSEVKDWTDRNILLAPG